MKKDLIFWGENGRLALEEAEVKYLQKMRERKVGISALSNRTGKAKAAEGLIKER